MAAQQVIVIGQGSNDSYPSVVFVDTISERNALVTNKIVIVRNAYKGDSSVNKGWAAYVLDPAKKTWAKLIEQESVDGPWGVNEEIKKNLVTKTQFEEFKKALGKLDPEHLVTDVDWNKEAGQGGIKNRPNIESGATDSETGKPVEWTADFDHLKVGDIKKLQTLGGTTTFSSALARLNQIATLFGAQTTVPTGNKPVKMYVTVNGVETEIEPGGNFREARVGFSDAAQQTPILVVGGSQASGNYAGLWWTEDGVNFHKSNATEGDWEQPVYSRRLKKWAAACGTSMSSGIRGIAFSSDGKTWTQTNKTESQPEIELYEDDDTTLFMCGYSISSNGESWSEAVYGDGDAAITNVSGCGPQAAPFTASGIGAGLLGYSGKCLYIATSAQCNINNKLHTFMCAIVDCSNTFNSNSTVKWYDIDSTDGAIVVGSTKMDSVQHFELNENGVTKHFLMVSTTGKHLAFYVQAPVGEVTLTDLMDQLNGGGDQIWLWKPAGVPTDVENMYETPYLCGDTIVMPTMSNEISGDGLYVINKDDFLAKHNTGQLPEWTHVTVAANGGTIHKGGYYKPEPITYTDGEVTKTVYCTTGYKYEASMLFSFDGASWYKSEYLVNSRPPFQFGNYIVFPMTDGTGVKYITLAEFVESIGVSTGSVKSDTIPKIGAEWTEEDIVSRLNALIAGYNSMVALIGLKV